jgi:hypothetical protein
VNPGLLRGEQASAAAEPLVLNLFEDLTLEALKERIEERTKTNYTWFGRIRGSGLSQVILVVDEETVTGNIFRDGELFQVRPGGKGIHTVRQVDQRRFPEEAPPIPVILPQEDFIPEAPTTPAADSGTTVIDVLVVYTADAAGASSNILAEIQLGIDETNQTYANSGILQRVRLVHAAQVTYSETGRSNTDLVRLQNQNDGYLDSVHSMRNTYGADIVSLWVENLGDDCGIGYLMTRVSPTFSSYAFNVVARDCATGYYSFGHEMGHIMGADHDRYVEPRDAAYSYSHGYVHLPGRWRTVMAYNQECSDSGFYCTRIPYWSNPEIRYEGTPTGVSQTGPDSADNRLTLNQTASTVAGFRASVASSLKLIGNLEHPRTRTTVSGISTIDGWALDGDGISKIEFFVDGRYAGEIPYGVARPDVASAYPDYPNAELSGFSTTYDFSRHSAGFHIIKVRLTSLDGKTLDLRSLIRVRK